MNARTISRGAVDGWLRLARFPLDSAIGLLPGNGTGARPAARLTLDRIDASARTVAGMILGDQLLRGEAQRRRAAAHEAERALRLRGEAQHKTEQADSRLEQRHEQLERQRAQAKQRAAAQSKQAKSTRAEKTHRVRAAEYKHLVASRQTAARASESVNGRVREARLQALESEGGALREKEQALTANDEARRLRKAASRTKAKRKSRST
jgi:hypothetical protein